MTEHSPKIGVVIPTYNRREIVGATLRSVLYQDLSDEALVVIIDDGSNDGTFEYLRDEFQSVICRVDNRLTGQSAALTKGGNVHLIRQKNMHVAEARNSGLRELLRLGCSYLTHQDAEDLSLPNKHRVLSAFLEEHPDVGLVHAEAQDMSYEGFLFAEGAGPCEQYFRRPRIGGSYWDRAARGGFGVGDLQAENYVHNQTTMYTRAAVMAVGTDAWFPPGVRFGEDWEFYQRLERAGVSFGFVSAYVAISRAHSGGISGTRHSGPTLDASLRLAVAESDFLKKADHYQDARARWTADFVTGLQRTGSHYDFAALIEHLLAEMLRWRDTGGTADALSIARRLERLQPSRLHPDDIELLTDRLVAQLSVAQPSLALATQLFALQPTRRHAEVLSVLLG